MTSMGSSFGLGQAVREAGEAIATRSANRFGGDIRPKLGRAVDYDGVLVWSGTGRPLSVCEMKMRPKRCDVWLRAFDGVYRFHLTLRQDREIANEHPLGVMLAGASGEDEAIATRNVPQAAYIKLVRAALISGGIGFVGGTEVTVGPATATALAAKLERQPITKTWQLARAILQAVLNGRPATPEEVAAFTIPPGPPIVPAWAREQAA